MIANPYPRTLIETGISGHRIAQMRRKRDTRSTREFHITFENLVWTPDEIADKVNQAIRKTAPKTQQKVTKWKTRTQRWMSGYLSRRI